MAIRIIVLTMTLIASTSSYAQKENSIETSDKQSLSKTVGENLFSEKCGMCHRENGMGTNVLARRVDPSVSMLEDRDNLTTPFVTHVVRNGFITMFSISRAEVSNDQLNEIAIYLSKTEANAQTNETNNDNKQ